MNRELIGRALGHFLICVWLLVTAYVVVAFAAWQLNPALWTVEARALLPAPVVFYLIIMTGYTLTIGRSG